MGVVRNSGQSCGEHRASLWQQIVCWSLVQVKSSSNETAESQVKRAFILLYQSGRKYSCESSRVSCVCFFISLDLPELYWNYRSLLEKLTEASRKSKAFHSNEQTLARDPIRCEYHYASWSCFCWLDIGAHGQRTFASSTPEQFRLSPHYPFWITWIQTLLCVTHTHRGSRLDCVPGWLKGVDVELAHGQCNMITPTQKQNCKLVVSKELELNLYNSQLVSWANDQQRN